MKLVLDTNIIVAACMGSYAANRLLASCLRGVHVPIVGAALLAEYEDVVNRANIFADCRLNQKERNELLDALLSVSKWTQIYFLWRPNLRDEADNHVLELAVAAQADYLITRNLKDFGRAELLFPQLQICTPETFLEENP